jgi:glycosyltransferase involved in cell wall biosynthesis
MTADSPLVSVVMTSFNGLPYIGEAVASVLAQTYDNWELVISDDGSTDGSREWLRSLDDPRIRTFFRETNLGYVPNKNFAHAQARGELVTQLDHDDTSKPERLTRQVAALQAHGVPICGCGFERLRADGTVAYEVGLERDEILRSPPEGEYPFWFPSLMVRRSVLEQVGPFNSYFAFGDDLYWTVLANERFPILCLADRLYGYRETPGSMTAVLDRPDKIVTVAVLAELLRQRRERGFDWLAEKRFDLLSEFEASVRADRHYLAEQFRIQSLRASGAGNVPAAWAVLARSLQLKPANKAAWGTLSLLLKRAWRASR